MKFSSQCKTAQKFKAEAENPEAVEWFKNIHVPKCPKCRKHAPAAAIKPKVVRLKGNRFTVSSFSDPKIKYVVVKQGAHYACSCKSWIYSNPRQDCKHIKKIRKAA